MAVFIHPHARDRLIERGATEEEVVDSVMTGERFPAKYGRVGFRKNFGYNRAWQGRKYSTKQIEAYAVDEKDWLVITVIVKFF